MRRLFRTTVFLVVVGVIVAIGIAIYQGAGPLPDPEGCSAKVAGRDVSMDTGQGEVATLISAIGVQRQLPARAVSIALATGMQESKLRNLSSGDADSLGIFQQRPSQGWGSRSQIMDPIYAINTFYDALEKIHGYQTMRITEAAQRVQRSAYPDAYEVHALDARALASALTGYSGGGRFSCVVHDSGDRGRASVVMGSLTSAFGPLSITRGARQDLAVTVPAGPTGRRLGWAVAQYVVGHANSLRVRGIGYDHKQWRIGRDSEHGWTGDSSASPTRVTISMG